MALNFLQQLLLPEGLFLRPGEELLIPVRYRVRGDDSSLELSGLGGIILFDPDQLKFLGYEEETAVTPELFFQKPDRSYSEESLYQSLTDAKKQVDADLDGVADTKAGIPFNYFAANADVDDDPNTAWDGELDWPGADAKAATSDEGLTLFNLRFEALDGFSGSPLTAIVTTTHEGYEGAGDNQEIEAETSGSKPTQDIYSTPSSITYRPGTDISIPITYSTSDYDANLSGIQLNIHYNSNFLDPIAEAPLTNLLELEAEGIKTTSESENTDKDELTDEMIQASWLTIQNTFPGTELPVQIARANFRTNSAAYDPITGAAISTTVNYTSDQNAINYDFNGTSTTLIPESFHLDVDGDSQLTALGDGLMVIRKMLSFTGNALTNMASSDKATVDTLAMHQWLQAGISNGNLDVDKDGETLAFGDGLMIIRYLFGFTGNALTDKALSNTSPYFGDPNAADHVMNNIESLKPQG